MIKISDVSQKSFGEFVCIRVLMSIGQVVRVEWAVTGRGRAEYHWHKGETGDDGGGGSVQVGAWRD